MKRLLLLLLVPWAGSALAEASVYSPRADSTALTIYRDGLALVTETRRVDLPAGPVTLLLQGVVDTLLPQSAVIAGLDRARLENNYDFDALTPRALMEHSVGKQVTVVRTNRATGTQTRALATIESATDGVVLRFDDGAEVLHCSGLPERLEFSEVPQELTAKPTLSVKLAAGTAGPRTVTVSYLAQRFTWSANYVAHLNAAGNKVDLLGWATLTNGTDTSFGGAQVQVVAGNIQTLFDFEGGSRPRSWNADPQAQGSEDRLPQIIPMPACYPVVSAQPPVTLRMGVTTVGDSLTSSDEELNEVMVTGTRIISREELGDYKLYRIDWPTDLNAHQTKQAAFLHAEHVSVERFYQVQFPLPGLRDYQDDFDAPVRASLRWKNDKATGLGEPMPAGNISVFDPGPDGEVLAGEARIDDHPVGSTVEFSFARALNLAVEHSVEALPGDDDKGGNGRVWRLAKRVSHRLINYKDVPVKVEVQPMASSYRWTTPEVAHASQRAQRRNGDPLWVINLPAAGEKRLSYEIRSESLP